MRHEDYLSLAVNETQTDIESQFSVLETSIINQISTLKDSI
jgi:hypothetical protein